MFPSNAPYSRGRLVHGLTLLFWNHYVLLAIATLATWLAAGHTMLREGHDSLPAFAVADALVQLVLAAGAAFGIWIALPLLDPRPRIRPLIGVIRAGAIGWVVATAFTLARTIGRDAAEARGTASAIEALLWATVIGVVAGYAARKGSR